MPQHEVPTVTDTTFQQFLLTLFQTFFQALATLFGPLISAGALRLFV